MARVSFVQWIYSLYGGGEERGELLLLLFLSLCYLSAFAFSKAQRDDHGPANMFENAFPLLSLRICCGNNYEVLFLRDSEHER